MVRRRFARYRVDRPLRAVLAGDKAPSLTIRGRCRVLGEGGVDAIMAELLELGQLVSLELSPNLRVSAAVRNRRSFHYGFEFVELHDGEKLAIKRLCQSYPASRTL